MATEQDECASERRKLIVDSAMLLRKQLNEKLNVQQVF